MSVNSSVTPKPAQKSFFKNMSLRYKTLLLLLLPGTFLLVFLFIPLFQMFALSFQDMDGAITLANYVKFFSNSIYIKVILLTLQVSFFVTIFCLLLGYPVAYAMTKCSKRVSTLIMIAVMIPFWTSLLVRTYSWMIMLQAKGIVNNALMSMGLIDEPLKLLHNITGVYIGMTHILLPYMILSLYPVLSSIDKNCINAARTLGANRFTTFFKVYFPLSIQGIAAGSILVFVMGIGYFITPSLLGGTEDTMISQMIQVQVSELLNWPLASTLSIILLIISMIVLVATKKIFKVDKL